MLLRLVRIGVLMASVMAVSARIVHAADPKPCVVLVSVDGLANFYLDDPKAEIPMIRRLVKEGVRAEGMVASMPTVTWPNHTTLVTGVTPAKHGVLGNSVLDRKTQQIVPLVVDPIFNKDEIVRVPTIYDVAKGAGLKTAALLWPASRGARTLDWTVPDVGTLDLVKQYATASLLEEFTQLGIPWEKQEEWWGAERIRERDEMFARMGLHVMQRHSPDLLLMHFVELDHAQHRFGPRSPQAYEALKNQDACVKLVWDELQRLRAGSATLLLVSDHGFVPYDQQILPNVLLRQEGLLTALGSRITGGSVRALAQGGACFIYVFDDPDRAGVTERLARRFRDVEGVDLVLTKETYAAQGLPDSSQNPHAPDLVLSAKSGYNFVDMPAGETVLVSRGGVVKGSHGSDPEQPDMHAAFIAWGAGINAGARLGVIRNTSVAPTLAALLRLEMKGTDGPVLDGILKK